MAFVFMAEAVPSGSLLIRDTVAALPASPWRAASLALLILGFGLKIGLVPGHVWMPLAYRAAPTPAAAVLSGAAVKAGIIGLIRFLPLGVAMPAWGEALGRRWNVLGLLRCRGRGHPGQPKDGAGLFECQPDGVAGGGARHGVGRGRPRRGAGREFLGGEPHPGQGCAVPRDRRRRHGRAAPGGRCCCPRRCWRWGSAGCPSPAARWQSSR